MSLLVLIILFCVGILQDALSARYLRYVQDNHIKSAVFLSVVITLLGCSVWMELLNQFLQKHYGAIIAYSLGGGIGTWLGLLKKKEEIEVLEKEETELVCENCSASSLELMEV